jgi:tyrosine aminotransferase
VAAANNVIITNGCSGALEIILSSILDTVPTNTNRTKSVLFVPSPGFPLYTVLAESHGCSCVEYYPLRPDCNWEIDLPYLRQLLRKYHCSSSFCSTKSSEHASTQQSQLCLILTNPSNPTGTVFTKRHLTDVITLCNEYHVCVIADEVYGDLVFDHSSTTNTTTTTTGGGGGTRTITKTNGIKFYPVADIVAELGSTVQVPVITVSGLAKQFLLPGWRIGWIVFRAKYVSKYKTILLLG